MLIPFIFLAGIAVAGCSTSPPPPPPEPEGDKVDINPAEFQQQHNNFL